CFCSPGNAGYCWPGHHRPDHQRSLYSDTKDGQPVPTLGLTGGPDAGVCADELIFLDLSTLGPTYCYFSWLRRDRGHITYYGLFTGMHGRTIRDQWSAGNREYPRPLRSTLGLGHAPDLIADPMPG